jgi:hypothetical protein
MRYDEDAMILKPSSASEIDCIDSHVLIPTRETEEQPAKYEKLSKGDHLSVFKC